MSKVKLILDWPIPENQKELQQFMGSVNYLSKFLAFLSDLHAPLQLLLKKDSEFIWTDTHTIAFNCLKEHVSNDVKLQFFDCSKPLFIEVDASKHGIGAAMLQSDPIFKNSSTSEIPDNLHPISYASKTLSETESNYSNIERELLGVIFATTHFKYFTYGRPVTIISDHKPLVSLFKKSLTGSSPHLSRMLLQNLDYDLNIIYHEGSKMHLSDAISRLSSHKPNHGSTLPGMDITVHEIETCTNFSTVSLGKIHEAMLRVQDLQVLKSHITNGFPISTNQCPECIRPFFPYRDELTIYNGLVLKGHHIVIPSELCNQLLNVIHESHLGICKTLDRARTSIFWPGITNAVKALLSQCRVCVQHQDKQPSESIVSDPKLKPWTSLSINNFEYKGRHYPIILDRCTKFVVVKHVHSYDAGTTVKTMCEVFSEFGLPENICHDRGRNFLSNQFTQFLNDLGIDLTFCIVYHHSSNPAEHAIRNVKNLMKHCGSTNKPWHISLLEYLATPLSTGLPSPAAMMGRDFRGLLPHLQHFLPDSTTELLVQCHQNQVHPGGHDLPDISIGSNVTFLDHRTNKWYPVQVKN